MAGLTNYLRNKLVDWFHRGVAFTPPDPVYITLVSTTPTPSAGGTELSGSGFARVSVAKSTTAWAATNADGSTSGTSSGTNGTTSNNAIIDFGTAAAAWGTATHWEMYDASTAGNRLMYGTIVDGLGVATPRSIALGDPVSFPISALRPIWA